MEVAAIRLWAILIKHAWEDPEIVSRDDTGLEVEPLEVQERSPS